MALVKKTIKVELLYDDTITANPDDMDLAEIQYEMTEGSMSGVTETVSTDILTQEQMQEALVNQGSDPDFLTGN